MTEQIDARLDPLLPDRILPAETTGSRLLARVDGDALNRESEAAELEFVMSAVKSMKSIGSS
ncbi:hypothetical protein ACFWWT_49320 [Streptomyces sp. NPDC058676]|uniref:hypothetical protein n=1 Tax=unclassified Streptomyces TaxID=2593676 RepID=UPI0036563FCC